MREPHNALEQWLLSAFDVCVTAIGLMKSQGKDTTQLEERLHGIMKSLQDFSVEVSGQMKQFLCEQLAAQGFVVSPDEIQVVPVPVGQTPEGFLQSLTESDRKNDPTLN